MRRRTDRFGRTTATMAAMLLSGACAMLVGFAFGSAPAPVLAIEPLLGVVAMARRRRDASAARLAGGRRYVALFPSPGPTPAGRRCCGA